MPERRQSPDQEAIECRALERDLVAQLSPDKKTQQKHRQKAEQLRQVLERIKKRKRNA